MNTVFDCRLIELGKHKAGRRGNLTVVEGEETVPFEIKRVYYIYDVPGGESRGAHAHRHLQQLIVAASGSFHVVVDDGKRKQNFFLSHPDVALYMPRGLWGELTDFSAGAVALVLASDFFSEEDYIRDYDEYQDFVKSNGKR